jgi:hypothetical protein
MHLRIIYLAALVMVWPNVIRAEEMPNTLGLFEHICIGSRLDVSVLEKSIEAVVSQFKIRSMPMQLDMLRMANLDAKKGWGLAATDKSFVVTYAEKNMPDGVSRSCGVTVEADQYAEAKTFIEGRFKSRKIVEEIQGSYRIVLYEVALMGFQRPMLMSIQSLDPKVMKEKITAVAFFEHPSKGR